jgi:hypothetical protein
MLFLLQSPDILEDWVLRSGVATAICVAKLNGSVEPPGLA